MLHCVASFGFKALYPTIVQTPAASTKPIGYSPCFMDEQIRITIAETIARTLKSRSLEGFMEDCFVVVRVVPLWLGGTAENLMRARSARLQLICQAMTRLGQTQGSSDLPARSHCHPSLLHLPPLFHVDN